MSSIAASTAIYIKILIFSLINNVVPTVAAVLDFPVLSICTILCVLYNIARLVTTAGFVKIETGAEISETVISITDVLTYPKLIFVAVVLPEMYIAAYGA